MLPLPVQGSQDWPAWEEAADLYLQLQVCNGWGPPSVLGTSAVCCCQSRIDLVPVAAHGAVHLNPAHASAPAAPCTLQMYQQAAFCIEELLLHAPADATRCAGTDALIGCWACRELWSGPAMPAAVGRPM